MLKPTPHFSYEKSPLNLAGCIIDIIRKSKVISFSDLLEKLVTTYKFDKDLNEVNSHILPAIDLLFILGSIEYYSQNDSFVFVENRCR